MIIHGSIKHTENGRKKKTTSRRVTRKPSAKTFRPVVNSYLRDRVSSVRQYESRTAETLATPADTSYRQEVSSNYTISIPYNKGAYQVIPLDDVNKIGRS